jgi:hypothetical protein
VTPEGAVTGPEPVEPSVSGLQAVNAEGRR